MPLTELEATRITDKEIVLKDSKGIEAFYNAVKDDDDIILKYQEDKKDKFKLYICEGLLSKLKDGSLILTAEGGK